jgi:hypothetical protein
MDNKQKDWVALGLQGAGIVGGVVATATGNPVAGAAVVGAANVGAAAIQASKSAPKTPGSSGEQNALLALQMQQANKAAGLEGLSAQQIADIQDVNFNQALKMQHVINSYSQIKGMDIASQQILADQIIRDMTSQKRDITREIAMMDATAITKNLAVASETSQAAMQTATVIRNIEADKRDKELRFKAASADALKTSIANSVKLIGTTYMYQKAQEREDAKLADKEAEKQAPIDKALIEENRGYASRDQTNKNLYDQTISTNSAREATINDNAEKIASMTDMSGKRLYTDAEAYQMAKQGAYPEDFEMVGYKPWDMYN